MWIFAGSDDSEHGFWLSWAVTGGSGVCNITTNRPVGWWHGFDSALVCSSELIHLTSISCADRIFLHGNTGLVASSIKMAYILVWSPRILSKFIYFQRYWKEMADDIKIVLHVFVWCLDLSLCYFFSITHSYCTVYNNKRINDLWLWRNSKLFKEMRDLV